MVNILDLLKECGMEPRKMSGSKGGEYHCACPGCGDGGKGRNSDRFHAWPDQNDAQGSWWCRQCNQGGDVIQFMREFQGKTFKEAASRSGKKVEGQNYQPFKTPVRPQNAKPLQDLAPEKSSRESPDLWREKAAKLVAWSHENLKSNKEQLRKLADRGLNIKAVERFRLGWNPGERGRDIFRPRDAWGLPEEISEKTGKPKKLWIPRGLVIPFLDDFGRVERLRIRLQEGEPKYYVLPGGVCDPIPLLAMPSSWPGQHQAVIVCESELDGMLISMSAGDVAGVVALGSSSAKPRHETAYRMVQSAAWIGLALDQDQAGDEALQWWLENYECSRDIRPEDVKDPGELIDKGRDVREWVLSCLPPAWRPGRISVLERGFREGAGQQSGDERAGDRVPGAVIELARLMRRFPDVRLEVQENRWSLFARDKKGKDIYFWDLNDRSNGKRLHDLFWFDSDVEKYLLSKGYGVYGKDNIL